MMDASKLEEKLPLFAAQLGKTHIYGWKNLLEKPNVLLIYLVTKQYLSEEVLAILPLAWHRYLDTSEGVANTAHDYSMLKKRQLDVFPNTSYPYERFDMQWLASSIASFCG